MPQPHATSPLDLLKPVPLVSPVDPPAAFGIIPAMTARVPRIGRLALLALVLAALGGCVPEYNPQPVRAESDVLTDVTQLTRPGGPDGFDRAGQGRFSPDGRWVAFRGLPHDPGHTLFQVDDYALYVARVRWSGDRGSPDTRIVGLDRPVRITRVGLVAGGACFSPDGFSLAFCAGPVVNDGRAGPAMSLYRADNWEQAVAMTDVARGVDLAQHPISPAVPDGRVSPANLSVYDCDWAPSGKSIVVTAADGTYAGLYSLRPDGSHPIRLGPADARDPAFSPDGTRVAYCTGHGTPGSPGTGRSQVAVGRIVLDVSGDVVGIADPQVLNAATDVVATGPCWLPDGHRLLYAATRTVPLSANPSDPPHRGGLYVMNADGNRKTRLTLAPGLNVLPSLSPDGRHLLWTAVGRGATDPQLFAAGFRLPAGS